MPAKLKLGENHRRVVSVLLRGVERACDEIEAALADSDGLLHRVSADLTVDQQSSLRQMAERVRSELARITSQIELDVSVHSQRRRILALLSSSIVNLEESTPAKLGGYGELSPEAESRLETEFARLLALLNEMESTLERD
jgi:NAD(P)-dependent dehydrogenase (short-subunit alcohol dehydrogenase family)